MNLACKLLTILAVCSTSLSARSNESLNKAINVAKDKIERREARIKSNESKFASLKLSKPNVAVIKSQTQMADFGKETFVCNKTYFPWPQKHSNHEYKDCEYRLNIADPIDVKKLYATIKLMKIQGWEVEKQEVFQQEIKNESLIKNVERYRYSRQNK